MNKSLAKDRPRPLIDVSARPIVDYHPTVRDLCSGLLCSQQLKGRNMDCVFPLPLSDGPALYPLTAGDALPIAAFFVGESGLGRFGRRVPPTFLEDLDTEFPVNTLSLGVRQRPTLAVHLVARPALSLSTINGDRLDVERCVPLHDEAPPASLGRDTQVSH
ncbi:hypothetical protein [Streptomyces sp. or20]|uniref:hypothetical protein n=1 Tax=Streptomyces sp. or20 TaxID=1828016 RepID=UPI0011810E94|nr:hypothetical protein [Streptomyces sp. or20]